MIDMMIQKHADGGVQLIFHAKSKVTVLSEIYLEKDEALNLLEALNRMLDKEGTQA